jgi:3-deoxy-D-manno-octulosonic-acid transferase
MLFSFFYDLVLLLFALPYITWQRLFGGKYKESFSARLGFHLPQFPPSDKVIWIHAVSLGETRAVIPLYQQLRKAHPDTRFVISSTTETGHREAKRGMPDAAAHFFLPLDLSFIMKKAMKQIHPQTLILVEGDLWYHFLTSAKKQGARCFLVNGKISERSANRFKKIPFFIHRLLACFDGICLQSERFYQRFKELGADPSKLVVTGNLKYDFVVPHLTPTEKDQLKEELGITEQDRVLVIGSTHDPEEEELLTALEPVWKKIPHLKVLIVPRHPERFPLVAALLEKRHISFFSYTQRSQKRGGERVILIDTMGLLLSCYQLADIAIVAGSFTDRVGGHNIMEPSQYAVPVLFGPYMHTQLDMVDEMLRAGAGLQVSLNELDKALLTLLLTPGKRQQLGSAGLTLTQSMKGATQKTFQIIS